MGVKFNEEPDDVECISCMACMTEACKESAIYVEVGGVPLGRAPRPKLPLAGKIT
jgi:ferredoxin